MEPGLAQLKKFIAEMLRDYGEYRSCRGCNDYLVPNDDRGRALATLVQEWCGDPDYEAHVVDDQIVLYDWMVAKALADWIEKNL